MSKYKAAISGNVIIGASVLKGMSFSEVEEAFGVDYRILIKFSVCNETEPTHINAAELSKYAHIIKAIRNDPTGLTAAMYGINLDKE
ncbi:hypothetical protein [Aeromonas veronii]|uniref:hypothetical protein n=1 Tax=Aeromonas veronii TaxID=654 RepID=UPI003D1B1FB5